MYTIFSVQLQGDQRSKMGLIEEIKGKTPSFGDFLTLKRLSTQRRYPLGNYPHRFEYQT